MPFFKVIRASAGSGKTFNLTHEYLRLLFSGEDVFMHILAVTFTNKATEEMKSRIVRELHVLSSGDASKQLEGLLRSTGLTEMQIRNKAGIILTQLLHNYSRFSVSTIDAFFQRIIRSFTRELGIQEGYAIELDTESLLNEIIDQLMIKAENDTALLSWLTMFAESLIEKGESWNFKKGILHLGREIFSEGFKCLDEASLKLFSDRGFLNEYKTRLHSLRGKIENDCRDFGLKASSVIASHGLTLDDFSNKGRGPAGFLVKLSNGILREPTVTALNAASSAEKWHTASSPQKSLISSIASAELMPLMQQFIEYYQNYHRSYFTTSVILKNLFTLGILTDLSHLADAWCSDNNTFLLPEAPGFLHKIIDGNDTPFIYEKAGCWYHHFMIDEFQDTSHLQWMNFKPLISNSLSQDYDNLAVGDAKQSIYRWRNSNWEILENQIQHDFLPVVMKPVTLKENWRSLENIIQFNNHFFNSAATILQDEFDQLLSRNGDGRAPQGLKSITGLYSEMEQSPGNPERTGGTVQVETICTGEDTGYTETVCNKVVHLIRELQDKGYHLNDMAILTRKNSEAKLLADFLLKTANLQSDGRYRFDVISDEALRLGNSVVVNTVVALLQYMINPLDQTNNYHLYSMVANYIRPAETQEKWLNPGGIEGNHHKDPDFSLPEAFLLLAGSPESFSLTEIIERIMNIFQLERFNGEHVYILAFRDLVIEYSQKKGGDLSRFLEFWNETGREKSVSAPAGQDAIRILTLHKAKGLEFKITIIPFCTWELNSFGKSFLWCKPAEEPFNKLTTIPLSFTTQLQHTIFSDDYYLEYYRQYIDNLNLLYVAFTRAQEALFIFCKTRDDDQLRTVSDLSARVLGKSGTVIGTLPQNAALSEKKDSEMITHKPVPLANVSNRIKIAFQGKLFIDPAINKPSRPLNDGKILHLIFNLIKYREDVNAAITRLYQQGKIAGDEQDKYSQLIVNAMNDGQVSSWFAPGWNILNEAEIILPKGIIKRPDRVMTRENQTVVIDYKFGSGMESAHEEQVREYGQLLQNMGYEKVEAYLWYVKLGKVVSCRL